MRFKDKVAIITGAGAGLGRVSALLFAKEGAKVVVADVAPTSGEETVRLIREANGEAIFVHVDVSKAADCENMINTAVNHAPTNPVKSNQDPAKPMTNPTPPKPMEKPPPTSVATMERPT